MMNLEEDLKKCLSMINLDWKMQDNYQDKKTNFIYSCKTLDECLTKINEFSADKEYALHRWYNYMTSIAAEYIFCDYGAIHEKDVYNHDVDIYINKVPFDVKLTIYPNQLNTRPYDLKTRLGKNQMIRWYYANQSQQSRKQMLNRIYIVCDDDLPIERLKMKSDFQLLKTKIKLFMEHSIKNGLNQITIEGNGTTFNLYSDLIYISYN